MNGAPRDAGLRGCGDGLAGWFRDQLGTAAAGEELRVIVRDPAALVELPALTRLLGHTVLSIEPVDDTTHITVRKEVP